MSTASSQNSSTPHEAPTRTAAGADPLVRATVFGPVAGSADVDGACATAVAAPGANTWSWKGIPFARPPVGPLRWRAPVDPEPWSEPHPAHDFGAACLQNGRIYGPGAHNRCDDSVADTLGTPVGSEDCLSLNVWRPATSSTALPVLFFIHGGSNVSGFSADPVYDGARLAREADAVVVTCNYRLGVLGFFSLPQLHDDGADDVDASGNFALLDLLAALRFVRDSIAGFGGDAGNVTVMGQSAGAINLLALMASPLSAGLFHKAMPLSGGISLASNLPAGSLPTLLPAAAYAAQGRALLLNLLVGAGHAADVQAATAFADAQDAAWIADFMRAQDGATVLRTVIAAGLNGSGPIPDGLVLPPDPIAAFGAGRCARMPTLVGITRDEGKLFAAFLTLYGGPPGLKIDDATRFRMMQRFDPEAASTLTVDDIVDAAYLPVDRPDSGYDARSERLTRGFMGASRDSLMAALQPQRQSRTSGAPELWHYRFDWDQEPPPWNAVYGAAHVFDLPFVFGNFGPSLFANAICSRANESGRLALSAAVMASIAAFLRHGDPNCAALGTRWEPWPATLVLDASLDATRIRLEAATVPSAK
jgi:para-nitrobenzyl esterase